MKTNKKLSLNKTTVAHLVCVLDMGTLNMIKGGTGPTINPDTTPIETNSPMFC